MSSPGYEMVESLCRCISEQELTRVMALEGSKGMSPGSSPSLIATGYLAGFTSLSSVYRHACGPTAPSVLDAVGTSEKVAF